tara:strand:- start:109 stop:348 length:240 start_codon:yes stop_codon:yes gene_type:complete
MRKIKRRLIARYITKKDFLRYRKQMREDGLILELTEEGYEWRVGNYVTTNKSVAEVWGMTADQLRRFVNWAIEEDWWKE